MDRSLLKYSIDEWHELLLAARGSLIQRDHIPALPSLDMAVALTGVRRCGKTHVAFQMSQSLDIEEILYYNFEDPLFYSYNKIENLDLLLSVAQEYRANKISLLILDEIAVVDGWERWLRKLIDQKRYRIIVTGSSAKLLSSELATSLTGRALEYKIWPLSFSEVLKFKGVTPAKNERLFFVRELMQWGAMPEVVKSPVELRKRFLRQYLDDIVLKDVISRNQIRNKQALDQIVTFYLTNISSLHSYSAVSKAFGFDLTIAADYSARLSDAFLFQEVSRYHYNLKVQSRDPRKVYAIDPGFRTVGARSATDDTGKLLENIVFIELRRRGKDVYYYKGACEVDFVVVEHYKPIELIQVCCSDMREESVWNREVQALLEGMDALSLKEGAIISYDREENVKLNGKTIRIIPAHVWLIESK